MKIKLAQLETSRIALRLYLYLGPEYDGMKFINSWEK